jgi:hypothetical protein
LNFPETEQNAKNNQKKKINKLKGQIKYEQNLQCRKIKTSRKIHQSKNYVNFLNKNNRSPATAPKFDRTKNNTRQLHESFVIK